MQQRKKQKGENNLEECSGEDAKSKAKHRTAVHPRRVDEGALRHLCFQSNLTWSKILVKDLGRGEEAEGAGEEGEGAGEGIEGGLTNIWMMERFKKN